MDNGKENGTYYGIVGYIWDSTDSCATLCSPSNLQLLSVGIMTIAILIASPAPVAIVRGKTP